MYRYTLRSLPCRQSPLHCCFCHIRVRRLANAGSVPPVNSDQNLIETLEPWQENVTISPTQSKGDTKNIHVDDLTATLESHQASNRAPFIPRVKTTLHDTKTLQKRPLFLHQDSDEDSGDKRIHEEIHEKKEKTPIPMWPFDSVQAKALYGEKDCKTYCEKGDALEYAGTVAWCKGPWKQQRSFFETQDTPMKRPWLAYMRNTGEGHLERLTNEIQAYEAYMRLSPREESASELVIADVNSVALKGRETQPLNLLGSRSTGLATPTSDFDFSITSPGYLPECRIEDTSERASSSRRKAKSEAVKALRRLLRNFVLSGKFRNPELVLSARVPIIRCTHVATRLQVQIQTMVPYQAADEYKLASLAELPSLRPLYILLRSFLELRNLTTVFEGGLGSYSILMMIVVALKHSGGRFAPDNLGSQLMHVLDFWGNADLYAVGFSVDPPRAFDKQTGLTLDTARMDGPQLGCIHLIQALDPRKPYLLCLQDPANYTNDLGKNAYAIKHIQATFRYEVHNLRNRCSPKSSSRKSYLDFLEADYSHFEMSRCRVERYADPYNQDFIYGRPLRDYQKRVNQYNAPAKEDDNSPTPTPEAKDENAAESFKTADSVNGDTGSPRPPQNLTNTRSTSKLRWVMTSKKPV